MNMMIQNWVDVGALEDIPRQGSRIVRLGGQCIALFRTASDEVYALEDQCPHKKGPLSQGIVHGNSVTCPLHNFVIDLESGAVQGPDEGRVQSIRVRMESERILLDYSAFVQAAE